MTFLRRSLLFIFLCPMAVGMAQDHLKEEVMLRAMKDELDKNKRALQLQDLDKPFFILYRVVDQKNYFISSMLGSLVKSSEVPSRNKNNVRILVGDYAFNDESLEDDLYSSPTAHEINLPLEDDYYGIRRAFWSTTDNVYRSAARHFKKHQETLKETGKSLQEIPHRSFAKAPAVTIQKSLNTTPFEKEKWEGVTRNLSALFLDHPSIENSVVMVQYVEGYEYTVTSEGTLAKIPFSLAKFLAVAQSKNANGEFALEQVEHTTRFHQQLPSEQQLAMEITKMLDGMKEQAKLPALDEEYTGPVLLLGPSVASVFSSTLLGGRESLMASDNIRKLSGYQFDNDMYSLESKIGKSILHESFTIKAKPHLSTFKYIDLLGSFEMDDEGIVPAAELTLVEKGILKNLMNNRTLTNEQQSANGLGSGPGVLEVTLDMKDSETALKTKLLAQAKKEGLDYAIIVREETGIRQGLLNVYKIFVEDGREEMVRYAMLNPGNFKTLKKILGATANYQAHNIGMGGGGYGMEPTMLSLIVPAGLLVEEMSLQPLRMPSLKQEEYVKSPLLDK